MDASLSLAGLVEEFNAHLESGDFEGAEEILARSLHAPGASGTGVGPPNAGISNVGISSVTEAFGHYQYGRLYVRWNKLTSAIHHLNRAAELARLGKEEIFLIQVLDELRRAKSLQAKQRP